MKCYTFSHQTPFHWVWLKNMLSYWICALYMRRETCVVTSGVCVLVIVSNYIHHSNCVKMIYHGGHTNEIERLHRDIPAATIHHLAWKMEIVQINVHYIIKPSHLGFQRDLSCFSSTDFKKQSAFRATLQHFQNSLWSVATKFIFMFIIMPPHHCGDLFLFFT